MALLHSNLVPSQYVSRMVLINKTLMDFLINVKQNKDYHDETLLLTYIVGDQLAKTLVNNV